MKKQALGNELTEQKELEKAVFLKRKKERETWSRRKAEIEEMKALIEIGQKSNSKFKKLIEENWLT